ncbi:peptidase S41, partial [Burkholderia cepacia]
MMPSTRAVLRLAVCAAVTAAFLPCASPVRAQQPAPAPPASAPAASFSSSASPATARPPSP